MGGVNDSLAQAALNGGAGKPDVQNSREYQESLELGLGSLEAQSLD